MTFDRLAFTGVLIGVPLSRSNRWCKHKPQVAVSRPDCAFVSVERGV